jgi:hypothetical protein
MSHAFRLRNFKHFSQVGASHVWQLKRAPKEAAFFFESGLSVDADGAPKAYGPPGLAGTLDRLGNAGHPGNWWGIVTDRQGNPVVQNGTAPQQPFRGFYISRTALFNPGLDETDVRRYADATQTPYIALPPTYFHGTHLQLGDYALLINGNNGQYTFAVFADTKKQPNLGEISICASAALGGPIDARSGSLPRGIITLVFPNSGIHMGVRDAHTIAVCGRLSLEHFSEFRDKSNALLAAFPEYPRFARALQDAGYVS